MTDVYSLDRNDVDGAVEFYRKSALAGTLRPEDVSILIQLQDDSTELERRLDEVDQEPTVAAALAAHRQ